jgi:hypothetical protein
VHPSYLCYTPEHPNWQRPELQSYQAFQAHQRTYGASHMTQAYAPNHSTRYRTMQPKAAVHHSEEETDRSDKRRASGRLSKEVDKRSKQPRKNRSDDSELSDYSPEPRKVKGKARDEPRRSRRESYSPPRRVESYDRRRQESRYDRRDRNDSRSNRPRRPRSRDGRSSRR